MWQTLIPFLSILLLIFFIGIWSVRYTREATDSFLDDYYLGSRSLGGFVLAMTMTATYGSASSFLGGPGQAYFQGLGWVLLSMTQVATGYFVLMILGKKFAMITRKYRAVTLVDYLKNRYQSKWVVLISSISIVVFLFSAMAAQWIGGAHLIESLTGLSYLGALFIFALAVIIYVVVGGFRAVAMTDAIQGGIMFLGTLVLLIATIIAGGGVSNIMADLQEINPNLVTPYGAKGDLSIAYVSSFWILVGVGVVALPQIAIRAMSYKSSRSMHRAIIIGTIVVGFIMLNMHLIGVFARPIMPGIDIADTDKIMPMLALNILPPWVAGIVLAAPMAAIMSTVDSLLLLVSSTIVKDLYLNYVEPKATQKRIKRISISVTAGLGLVVFLMAINPSDFIIWLNLFTFGGLEAAFIWPVVLGLYWKKGNKYGAIASMIVGISLYILSDTFYPRPFGLHSVVLPVLFSLIAYVFASLFTHQKITEKQFD